MSTRAVPAHHSAIVLLMAIGLGLGHRAAAQSAWSASAETEYRHRGVSLSEGHAAVHLNYSQDWASGWYLQASGASWQGAKAMYVYAGQAHRLDSERSWDAGATLALFSNAPLYDYVEVFVGLSSSQWNARVHVSPSYFGSGVATVYTEINGGFEWKPAWIVFAHAGALSTLGRGAADESPSRVRRDLLVGISARLSVDEWQLSRQFASRGQPPAGSYGHPSTAWVLRVTHFF